MAVPFFVPIFNSLVQRLLRLGVPMGPNALLSVRGRKTGLVRTTPVALIGVGGRRWISSPYGEVQWVRNLRAAGQATLIVGRRHETVRAVELDREETGRFFAETFAPFVRRTPLGAWMIGSVLGARDMVEDPHRAAERHPVFELRPPE